MRAKYMLERRNLSLILKCEIFRFQVIWYKDDLLLYHGTKFSNSSTLNPKSYKLLHKVTPNYDKGIL